VIPSPGRKLRKIVLVGTPNSGKSVVFRLLTGCYQIVSNYPGTTVEVVRGNMSVGGSDYEVIDTPGVNSIVPQSEDERVACEILLSERPSLILQVADAKNLRRTLLVTLQLAEFRIPTILILNMMDEAEERGISLDTRGISELFGIPVLETVAIYRRGLQHLGAAIAAASAPKLPLQDSAGAADAVRDIDVPPGVPVGLMPEWLRLEDRAFLDRVEVSVGYGRVAELRARLSAPSIVSGIANARQRFLDESVCRYMRKRRTEWTAPEARQLRVGLAWLAAGAGLVAWNEVGSWLAVPAPYTWLQRSFASGASRDWIAEAMLHGGVIHAFAPILVHLLLFVVPVVWPLQVLMARCPGFDRELGVATRRPASGIPILVGILIVIYEFVGVIGAQLLVGLLEKGLFGRLLIPWLQQVIPAGFAWDLLVGKFGLVSMGLTYAIAIILPIVATFFIAFGIVEDSGYLPRLSVLSDRLFRAMGLNGKAVLPMVLGLGCCTMATMTTRILNTRKERLIATLLLALGVPCSAQLGVILGITSGFSPKATVTVLGVVALQLVLVGTLAAKLFRGERSSFLFDIPPIRVPQLANILLKTGYRVQWYLKEAVPLFLYGTMALFALDRLSVNGRSLLVWVESAFEPVVSGILRLPAETAPVFVLGFLRRDYGAAGLFDMVHRGALDARQAVVALVVITLFVPCLASFLMIAREQGTRRAVGITAFIIPFAIAVGAAVHWLLRAFEVFGG
jgi:ferrous iron transport protein B